MSFDIKKNAKIVKVSTHLIVDKASPNGLNFFAIQVNYPNKTWAHGGPQINKKGDTLIHYANWGGLVNRGGSSKDYKEADPAKDLVLIECGIGKPNTVPWEWKLNCEYLLTVERGKQVHLPAGESHNVHVAERTMWEWNFTITPVGKDQSQPAFTALLYNSAECIKNFYLWNEAGYGSTSAEQHARWSPPTYWTDGNTKEEATKKWTRF
ncbi:MAG: hypothetical protein NTY53_23290 [Kiritimatiellaeota bacterium]|nr:hypothetical protein [Kiritimatiellota bacterium]